MAKSMPAAGKVIWLDLDNTPHVPFFSPIIEELKARGYTIKVTVRDAYQTCELADFFQLDYERVGRHYGRHRILKIVGTCIRTIQLVQTVRKLAPSLAIGHSSRSLTLGSALLGIPCLQIIDYEYGASAGFAKPTWLMMPDVISAQKVRAGMVLGYPGIKEDVYVPRFVPDASLQTQLGLKPSEVVVALRPPATEAHYHTAASDELFDGVIDLLARTPNTKGVLVPRNGRQEKTVRGRWPELFSSGKLIIPDRAVDGLNLIWHSDLVVSGGGTMNREAAALGVPVYSVFRGTIGAVDHHLAQTGRLTLLESTDDVRTKIVFQKRQTDLSPRNGDALRAIVEQVVSLVEFGKPTVFRTFEETSEVSMKAAKS